MKLLRPLALALAALAALQLPASAQQAGRQWITGGPNPTRYEISITPNAETLTFTGEVTIAVENPEAAGSVTLNALDLTVARASIDGQAVQYAANEEAQTLTLTPRRPLRAGRHSIRIAYSGKIYEEAYGLFRTVYQADGQTRHALATQFEPGDARRFAPMWDQPNRRAVFSLTVTAPANQMVISNMPVQTTQRLSGGMARTRFQDTPAMASYLLFFGMGDFERIHQEVNGVDVGVIVRRGEGVRAHEALRAGVESITYYNDYFGIPYPLPKLDMIGVPGAGGFGAMENWGAILYFDQYLLVDPQRSSEAERQNVFGIVAHEIAHQWFGDLVTMNWWNDLWLNEGFASWMAAKATEAIHPDWNPWMAQMTDGTATAMALDARQGTHPVVQEVNTIDDANLAFDTITYEKGLAVIRMVEAYVGEDAFRTGVRQYLRDHAYGNTETNDLWSAVQRASGQPVLEIARSFTSQPGYPLLTVSGAACPRGRGAGTVTVAQRRFAMDESARTSALWDVPVVVQRVGGQPVRAVLPASQTSSVDPGGACDQPYLVNAGQSGFFRVLYDRANLTRLTENFRSLSATDQLGLLLDYYTFGRSGDASFTDYLDLMARVPADADPVIAQDTVGSVLAFVSYTQDRPSAAGVRAYGIRTLRPFFARVGWNPRQGELSNEAKLRAGLISALGELGDAEVIAEARRRAADQASLPASIRSAVIDVYAYNARPADYDALLAQARAAGDFVEKRRLYLLLARAHDPALARRTLDLAMTDEVPRQIRTQVIAVVAGEHPRLGWDYLRQHRAQIEPLLDPLQRLEFPTDIAATNSDPAVADELEAYARDFPEGARPSVQAATSTIRLRAQTIAQRMPEVEAWIARQSAPAPRAQRGRGR
ncbi:M1 family metallopeptidase [Terricaulis sp.]|uniref:M1 family metallopeptidase n=1 Tax=Terricaulis sp. TaxID=2768686 RepID=UPI0037842A85